MIYNESIEFRVLGLIGMLLNSLLGIRVKLLNYASSILDHLRVGSRDVLSVRLDDLSDSHFLESLATLSVDTEISDREESDSAGRLGRPFIGSDHF